MAFGDLFLAEIRAYRERQMEGSGVEPLFPLWALDTRWLAHEMIGLGLRAVLTCVDLRALDSTFVGRPYDLPFLAALPPRVDPCGENGEFHTFVFAGPMFSHPLAVRSGRVVTRDSFVFADVLPEGEPTVPPLGVGNTANSLAGQR